MDFSASLMSKSQVRVDGRTEPTSMAGWGWGAVLKESHGARGTGAPCLDPGLAASCWVTVGISPSLIPSSVPGPGHSDTHAVVVN